MTDENLDVNTSEENVGLSLDTDNVETAQITESAQAPVEKTFSQEEVNRLIASRVAKERQKAMQHYQGVQQANPRYQQAQTAQASDDADPVAQLQAIIDQRVDQRSAAIQAETRDRQIGSEFGRRISEAMASDPELAELYDDLQLDGRSHIDASLIRLTTDLDNTASVIKELAKYPEKFTTVTNLIANGKTTLAMNALSRISSAIKTNEVAQSQAKAPAPLGQIKPSNIGASGGTLSNKSSVNDFRAFLRSKR